jgi:outer membrane protein TolC
VIALRQLITIIESLFLMQKTFLFTLVLCFVLHASSGGQTLPAPDSPMQYVLDTLKGSRLPLNTAIDLALHGATSVQTAQAAYQAASGIHRREAGTFDPQLFFTFNRLVQDQPAASFFSGASVLTTTQNNTTGGVSFVLPTGTTITASLSTINLGTNSAFANLNPQ